MPSTPTADSAALRLSDYDFELPDALVAQHPPAVRGASRLLHVAPPDSIGPESSTASAPAPGARLADLAFADLPRLLAPGDLLVMNDTRVIKARLHGAKPSGGRIELLVERVTGERDAVAMIRASHPPQPGTRLAFDGASATVVSRDGAFFALAFDTPVLPLLERAGRLPLPPYIRHEADDQDDERYQTVYARHPGAVAAPTAGLHFDDAMLAALEAAGIGRAFVTLHVGAGTFQPVREEDPSRHVMHAERYHVPESTAEAIATAKARGGRVVAIGTTSLRTLEAAADTDGRVAAGWGETDLFVRPGYRFRVVDRLLTNFHLPKSTLLMLVAAFVGFDTMRTAYAHAVARRYRFFSYGDAMLVERAGR